jgi:hypothetical protein
MRRWFGICAAVLAMAATLLSTTQEPGTVALSYCGHYTYGPASGHVRVALSDNETHATRDAGRFGWILVEQGGLHPRVIQLTRKPRFLG